jgi:hypothetical protein
LTSLSQRPRKRDVFVHPGASAQDLAVGNTLAPFDRAVVEMERRWGVDKLPELVSPESAARWGSAMGKLNAAIEGDDLSELSARVGVCLRGLAALDAEAIQRGHQPVPAAVMVWEQDGKRIGVVQDLRDWPALKQTHPDLQLHSMREVFLALQHYGEMVAGVKDKFPGAEVVAIRPKSRIGEMIDDEIPW